MTQQIDELPEAHEEGFEEPKKETYVEPVLTQKETTEFVEAINIGASKKSLTIMGHEVTISTLTIFDELQVGAVSKPWEGSSAFPKAYKAAVVAASLQTVDYTPFFQPIQKSDEDNKVQIKFDKLKSYYGPFVDAVYREIVQMEAELKPLLEKLGK